jgi:hypothetical protein
MRMLGVVVGFACAAALGCASPRPQPHGDGVARVPADARSPDAAAETETELPVPVLPRAHVEGDVLFHWKAAREQLEARRRADKSDFFEPLAARGTVAATTDGTFVISLDVGTRDGVTAMHRAALIGEADAPITPFVPVAHLQDRRCDITVPDDDLIRHAALHFMVRRR